MDHTRYSSKALKAETFRAWVSLNGPHTIGISCGGAGQDQTLSAKRIRSSPEVFEPARRQLSIAHRVLDIPVPEVGLQRPRVVAFIASWTIIKKAKNGILASRVSNSGNGWSQSFLPKEA